ncbi:MAG: hypothetical protein OXD46_01465 [Chloroflexi bacterium]|nr:hypothetical protein [Chloroflexota bacterium]
MLILIAVLLALIPAAAILYPFVFRRGISTVFRDETSTYSELTNRWEAAIAGLKNTELEYTIGNLTEDDYRDLRGQYMLEAANIMKAMELEDQQEDELLASVAREVKAVRERLVGPSPDGEERTEDE